MAKSLKRVSIQILSEYLHQQLHFVRKDGSVIAGQITQQTSDGWKVKNSKGHLLHLPSDQIVEIWKDEKVSA